jgi:hydrogenase large subunit
MARISIDPVTRIEGHLRIDVEVDGGSVQQGLGELHHVART